MSKQKRACRRVWEIADSMPGARRKDVLQACVAAGINPYTAETQYFLWRHRKDPPAPKEQASA